ncbi:MAG: HlyD family efflux transporter periplasmic adaptor subunit [Bacteroidota bacterium]
MEEHEKIELRSEEVQEILGTPPSSVVRWGTTVAFLSISLMILVSYIVKYPDKIRAPITLTTSSPPVQMMTQMNGYIFELKVADKEEVGRGEIMVVLESTADYQDMLFLDSVVTELQYFDRQDLLVFQPPENLRLGTIQTSYSTFNQDFQEFIYGATNGYEIRNKEQLRRQRENTLNGIRNDKKKKEQTLQEMELIKRKQARMQKLYPSNYSLQDLEKVGQEILYLKRNIKEIESSIIGRQTRISEIDNLILQIDKGYSRDNKDNLIQLNESINRLKSKIEDWRQKHLITSPVDGIVSFHSYWNDQQFVVAGEEVMSIVPVGGDSIIGEVNMPSIGSGKVKVGQDVIIKFDGFPHEEYGSVRGKVLSKSLVPKDRKYRVIVEMPNGLMTSHKKELPFSQKMLGQAEIITEKKRFIEKIFEELLSRMDNFR